MRNGILQALVMLAGGLLLIIGLAITAALLAARINTSTLAASLAPPVAMASDNVLETSDVVGNMGSPVNISASTNDHRLVVFEHVSSYSASWDIFLADGQIGQVRQLTTHPATDRFPVLSPDGTQVAFISWRDRNSEIYLIRVEDGTLRNISNHPAFDLMPAWSPDGSMLAFVSERNGTGDIYLADVDRGLLHHLTHTPAYDASPQWAANGESITFRAYREGGWDAYLFTMDSRRPILMASYPYPTELNR